MYGRNRSPKNGYRGGEAGGGVGLTPTRSFNSGYRNFNRGFGRGSPRTSQISPPLPPPQQQQLRNPSPPTRKPDLFIEAGRLAAKYLVSQGLLPSESLSTNVYFSLSSLKNNNVDNNHESDGNSSCKTSPGDHNGSLMTSDMDRRTGRILSPETYDGSDGVSREDGAASLSESNKAAEFNDNASSAEVDSKGVNFEVCKPFSNSDTAALDVASKATSDHEIPDEITEKNNSSRSVNNDDHAGASTSEDSSKDHQSGINMEHEKTTVGVDNEVIEKDTAPVQEGVAIQQCEKGSNVLSENNTSELCHSETGFVESQTSLTGTGAKIDMVSVPEGSNAGDAAHADSAADLAVSVLDHNSSDKITLSYNGSECPDFYNSGAGSSLSVQNEGGEAACAVDQKKCANPQTCIDKTFMYDQHLSEALPEFQRCTSVVEEKGEKRALEDEYMGDRAKKAKHWPSIGSMDEQSPISVPKEKCSSTQSLEPPPVDKVVKASNHESSIGAFIFPRSDGLSSIEYNEEKQFFPESFRICDLNLMDASDINTNHSNLMTACPSTSGTNKEAPVHVDLSMGSNCISENVYCSVAKGKEAEVIDLEGNSLPEDRSFNAKTQAELAGMDHLPSHGQNPDDNPDAQDGYGLMISELIGNDIPNCHSVQPEIQPVGSEVGLPPSEVILNDDDSIYMSFGEIPLSILQMWDQPAQDNEKQF